jgi:6-pyruvoyltetrahydropterin/6-carboxytetrahydropterin synthase
VSPRHRVTKTYGHDLGLSCCFRQWRATSHCRFLHGYALAVRLEFGADQLDENGWVIDFGALKLVKQYLCDTFDHTLAVAGDDPMRADLEALADAGAAKVMIWENGIGTERFAYGIHQWVDLWLHEHGHAPRVSLLRTEVMEHAGNGAGYAP